MIYRKLKTGQGLIGAEPTGCCNSGVAAVIVNSREAKKYLVKKWAVGKAMDASFQLVENILQSMRGKPHKVKFYKSEKLAWAEFNRLNDIILAANKQDAAAIRQARKDLESKSHEKQMKAAFTLSDYGQL